jgi:hypothetical protein
MTGFGGVSAGKFARYRIARSGVTTIAGSQGAGTAIMFATIDPTDAGGTPLATDRGPGQAPRRLASPGRGCMLPHICVFRRGGVRESLMIEPAARMRARRRSPSGKPHEVVRVNGRGACEAL